MLDRAGEDTASENLFDGKGSLQRVAIETGEEQKAANLFADGGEEFHFVTGIGVGMAVLDIKDADNAIASDDGRGEEGLIGIGFEFGEGFEAGVVEGVAGERDEAAIARHPAGEAFFK